jgi:hypothetical protein
MPFCQIAVLHAGQRKESGPDDRQVRQKYIDPFEHYQISYLKMQCLYQAKNAHACPFQKHKNLFIFR